MEQSSYESLQFDCSWYGCVLDLGDQSEAAGGGFPDLAEIPLLHCRSCLHKSYTYFAFSERGLCFLVNLITRLIKSLSLKIAVKSHSI